MRRGQLALLTGAAFAVLVSFYALSLVWSGGSTERTASVAAARDIGGPFTMLDENGRRVTEADLTGKPSVLFFGFTYCPDVCPTTLFELTALMERLGRQADAMNVVMVTVDPERDTPEILKEYLGAFDERLRGFTGTPEEVRAIADAYRVEIERVETDTGYLVNHTALVFLMDAANEFVGTISYHEDADVAYAKLRRLLEAG